LRATAAEYFTNAGGKCLAWDHKDPRPDEVLSDHAAFAVEFERVVPREAK
jgi:hypothetical protein